MARPSKSAPPRRVVNLPPSTRVPSPAPTPTNATRDEISARRRVFGTLQLFVGLLIIVVAQVTEPFGGQLLFVIGLVLAASCIGWFGVLERKHMRSWQ